jgi:AcrR family transcriptional regulator
MDRAADDLPRTRRGQATRERLLGAARQVFGEVGWARARVEDVCRVAGTGHGTFYQYFPNRTALLVALVAQHASALNGLAEAPWTSGDIEADVHRVIDGFVAVSEQDRDVRAAWAAAAVDEPQLAALFGEVRRQFVARVRANLEAAVADGRARPELDLDVAATGLTAMVEHSVALDSAADPASRLGRSRLVAGLTDLWVSAVYR